MISKKAELLTGVRKGPYAAVGRALEVIPRTLAQNCGANPIRTLTALRVSSACVLFGLVVWIGDFFGFLQAKHAAAGNTSWGIDGTNGDLVDMKEYGVWEPAAVKVQTFKTAVEVLESDLHCFTTSILPCSVLMVLDCHSSATHRRHCFRYQEDGRCRQTKAASSGTNGRVDEG